MNCAKCNSACTDIKYTIRFAQCLLKSKEQYTIDFTKTKWCTDCLKIFFKDDYIFSECDILQVKDVMDSTEQKTELVNNKFNNLLLKVIERLYTNKNDEKMFKGLKEDIMKCFNEKNTDFSVIINITNNSYAITCNVFNNYF